MKSKNKAGRRFAGATCCPAPSWEEFVSELTKHAPQLHPVETDEKWQRLYAVYAMGYAQAMKYVKKLITEVQDNDQAHLQTR